MRRTIWLPIVLLALTSLACSLLGRAEQVIELGGEAATTVAEAATAVGEEALVSPEAGTSDDATEPADPDATVPDVDPDALAGLESYRMRLQTEWIPDEGDPESTTMEQAHTRNPRARRFVMGDGQGDAFEMVQIEDQAWYCSAGTCSQSEADPDDLATSFEDALPFDPTSASDDADANFVGRETVNGVQARRYALALTTLEAAVLAQGDVSDVEGYVWIADEPDLPIFTVRYELSWTETRDERGGRGRLTYEVYDVNAPITIEPPEGAEKSGLPEDIPPYPNAQGGFSMEGMTAFTSPDDVAAVADFYRDRLPAEGWTSESDEDTGDAVNQLWQKEGRELILMISSDNGETSVTIMVQ